MELGLSPRVRSGLAKMVDLVVERLESAGHSCRRRVPVRA
jgi:hypothetical protein